MNTRHVCKNCGGKGRIRCPRYNGCGTMDDNSKSTCYYCQGEKEVVCSTCNGEGMVDN